VTLSKISEAFSETEIDDEIIVMSLDKGDFFSLIGTSAEIWKLIDGTRDRDALVAELAAIYSADASEIGSDVDAFLLELSSAGFIA
jgi:pyrroloquinoline quinone biosynthesis protein D